MLSAVSGLWVIRVDDLDLKLLRILQRTATMPVAEIGERIGLSHTPCWRRMRRLEESGVILRRVAILSPGSVGLPVSVFASITMASHQNTALNSFERAVQKETQIVDCHSVTGTPDYLLRIIVPDVAAYERSLKEQPWNTYLTWAKCTQVFGSALSFLSPGSWDVNFVDRRASRTDAGTACSGGRGALPAGLERDYAQSR